MACDDTAHDSRSSYLTLADGGSAELDVPLYAGDFSASGLQADQSEAVAYTAQGVTHTVRKGNRVDPTGSFTAHFPGYAEAGKHRLVAFIERRGEYASNQRVGHVCGDAYLLDIRHRLRGNGLAKDMIREYRACRLTLDYSSGEPDSVSVSWTCYGEVLDYEIT